MDKLPIPAYVLAAIADAVSETETHASLDSLFMYAEAPGDPPDGSKAVKALEWLRRVNKECGELALSVIGRIIEKYMEPPEPSTSFWQPEAAIEAQKTRAFSSIGMTTFFTVPGNTVLRTTMVWRPVFSRSAAPICSHTASM
jgi:hypothetical protein